MSIEIIVRPPFREEWTNIESNGEYEDAVMNICVAALYNAGYEILVEDEDGNQTPYDEYEFPNG